jgi:hypothetical protein
VAVPPALTQKMRGIPLIGVPKAIDNDRPGTESTFRRPGRRTGPGAGHRRHAAHEAGAGRLGGGLSAEAGEGRGPVAESAVKCGVGPRWCFFPTMAFANLPIHAAGFIHQLGVPQLSQPKSGRTSARMA